LRLAQILALVHRQPITWVRRPAWLEMLKNAQSNVFCRNHRLRQKTLNWRIVQGVLLPVDGSWLNQGKPKHSGPTTERTHLN
jgi:hypothetical protein